MLIKHDFWQLTETAGADRWQRKEMLHALRRRAKVALIPSIKMKVIDIRIQST